MLVEGGQATGVSYLHQGELQTARANAEVILSGGAVNSPQLLMLSGIGPAEWLRPLGIEVMPVNVRDAAEIERAITDFARSPNGGVIVTANFGEKPVQRACAGTAVIDETITTASSPAMLPSSLLIK